MPLSKKQEEGLLEQVNDLLKQRDCPSGIRRIATEVREKLTSPTATPEQRHEAGKRLVEEIAAFAVQLANARPERGPPPRRGALPVPDDTPWAPPRPRKPAPP